MIQKKFESYFYSVKLVTVCFCLSQHIFTAYLTTSNFPPLITYNQNMFSIRYAGDIESRRSQSSNDRTFAEFKKSNPEFMSAWNKKTKVQKQKDIKMPTESDFPTMISTIPAKQQNHEIDQAILYDLQDSFYQEEQLQYEFFQEYFNLEPNMEFINEEEFLQYHYNDETSYYSEWE